MLQLLQAANHQLDAGLDVGRLLGENGRRGRQLAVTLFDKGQRLGQRHLEEEAQTHSDPEAAGVRDTRLAIEVAACEGNEGQLFICVTPR